jgi:hypothetical protein
LNVGFEISGGEAPKNFLRYQENWPLGTNLTIKEGTDSLRAKPLEISKSEFSKSQFSSISQQNSTVRVQ